MVLLVLEHQFWSKSALGSGPKTFVLILSNIMAYGFIEPLMWDPLIIDTTSGGSFDISTESLNVELGTVPSSFVYTGF